MAEPIRWFVPGIPKPGGSKRAFRNQYTGKIQMVDSGSEALKNWRASVAHEATFHFTAPLAGAILLCMEFFFPRPKSHLNKNGLLRAAAPHRHTKKPDCTKLLRSTEDALKGIAWLDDSQVVGQFGSKQYADAPGERPGAWITVEAV